MNFPNESFADDRNSAAMCSLFDSITGYERIAQSGELAKQIEEINRLRRALGETSAEVKPAQQRLAFLQKKSEGSLAMYDRFLARQQIPSQEEYIAELDRVRASLNSSYRQTDQGARAIAGNQNITENALATIIRSSEIRRQASALAELTSTGTQKVTERYSSIPVAASRERIRISDIAYTVRIPSKSLDGKIVGSIGKHDNQNLLAIPPSRIQLGEPGSASTHFVHQSTLNESNMTAEAARTIQDAPYLIAVREKGSTSTNPMIMRVTGEELAVMGHQSRSGRLRFVSPNDRGTDVDVFVINPAALMSGSRSPLQFQCTPPNPCYLINFDHGNFPRPNETDPGAFLNISRIGELNERLPNID